MTNNALIALTLVGALVLVIFLYVLSKRKKNIVIDEDYDTLDKLDSAIKEELTAIVKDDDTLNLSDAEFNALFARKNKIRKALVECVHGVEKSKIIVIELIRDFIEEQVDIKKVRELLGLVEGMIPTNEVMFEIILNKYKKAHGKDALSVLIKKYGWDNERTSTEAVTSKDVSYYVTEYDLHDVYLKENIDMSKEDMVYILAVISYQRFKGFGIIDTIREMNINGINIGVSGSIISNLNTKKDPTSQATNSVWIYFEGRYIHLRFLSFKDEKEIQRVVTMVSRYNSPGALTAKRGYIVNTAPDKSRVLAIRPPASEYWAAFIRKFTLSDPSPNALIIKKHTKRGDLPIRLIMYLIKGEMTLAYTGRQGSGKTTLMAATMRFIDPRYNIRVLELAPELYLRELYNYLNVLSVQETDTISSTQLQDALKKTDGAVSVAGEVATNDVASRMIQLAMTASQFTLFSHHATTAQKLVYTLRNSLVSSGDFSQAKEAEEQVLQVLKFDIHLEFTPEGDRFIERITEIIPLNETEEYPEYDENDPHSMNKITLEYYKRRTDRTNFICRDIIVYDRETKTYKAVNRISPANEKIIRNNLGVYREDYDKFIFSNWGRRPSEEMEFDEVTKAILNKYSDAIVETDILKEKPTLRNALKNVETLEQKRKREREQGIKRKGKLTILKGIVKSDTISLEKDSQNEKEVIPEVTVYEQGVTEEKSVDSTVEVVDISEIRDTEIKEDVIKEVIRQETKKEEEEKGAPSEIISEDRDLISEINSDSLDFTFFTGKEGV